MGAARPRVRAALGLLCALTLVVDASALSRLHLYSEVYGLTRLRVGVAATCLWLGAVLVLVLLAGRRPGPHRWLPHSVVLSAAVGLLALDALPEPERSCALVLWASEREACLSAADGWTSAKLARVRARAALTSRPVATATCFP